ncbi:MAG: glutamine--tRNA ligase/YqeY domain fusion protein [Gammaproteobacteria bacterium]|nr:glutamine--tRNA ligase/YqeY domain fusion protein [Gammaproteobacteria bacterium]
MSASADKPTHFIRQIIEADRAAGKHGGRVTTRFPPEPNGYLHIGHAKSICLNFGLAGDYGGECILRFDDTNPVREEDEYVRAIIEDVAWLGFRWTGDVRYASDYFDRMYELAEALIGKGLAYVDDQSAEEIRRTRGTLTEPGRPSPVRDRPVAENLALFRRMRAGEFADGTRVLRARIDMASPNLNLRDPVMYRILHARHHRTADRWCIYPMYDWAHGLEDSIEGVTHSICTLEFADHRPLYDWFLDSLGVFHPQQIEFARLNLDYTVMSKRKLHQLVTDGHVRGWDDPRMPTISGLRRRGCTPAAIRDFCERVGVTRKDTTIEMGLLENCIREDLDRSAARVLAVLRPLKVVIENYPPGEVEELDAPLHPNDPALGSRRLPFAREIYIEQDDFAEDPPPKFFRLAPGREVRLRYAYFITCTAVIRDPASGAVTELRCRYDPATRGGNAPDGRKVKGTLHWVSAAHAVTAEVRLYDRLFTVPDPEHDDKVHFLAHINPDSLAVIRDARVEPGLADAAPETRLQFERLGYFCVDRHDSAPGRPVFNRTVTLRDTWARIQGAGR